MEIEEFKDLLEEIISMHNNITILESNTNDAEISMYFKGFREALVWIETDVLRHERVKHNLVIKIEEQKG